VLQFPLRLAEVTTSPVFWRILADFQAFEVVIGS
jgi:hypothetical protein